MRKLASIQRIDTLLPIEGKDRIQSARVLGWNVIVTKDFSVGDKVIYVEIDSVLPEKPEFEFLRPKNFRIKTLKMAGTISQGICFPLSVLPEGNYEIGDDVTELLGIKQYEAGIDDYKKPELSHKKSKFLNFCMRYRLFKKFYLRNKASKENFPTELAHKTDEVRIQDAPWMLEDDTNTYLFTEKIDGTSGTYILNVKNRIFWKKYDFYGCSRNRRLRKDDGSVYWAVAKALDLKNVLIGLKKSWKSVKTVCIQGEIIAPKIQENKYKVTEPKFYVFNVILDGERMGSRSAKALMDECGINFVPIIMSNVRLPWLVKDVDTMIGLAHGQSMIGDTLREGLVVRSEDGQRSFKAVDPLFLIKYNE